MTFEDMLRHIESRDYTIASYTEVVEERVPLPDGLLDRAMKTKGFKPGCHVLYDPIDDEDGFMLIGSYEMVLKEGFEHIFSDDEPGDLAPEGWRVADTSTPQ